MKRVLSLLSLFSLICFSCNKGDYKTMDVNDFESLINTDEVQLVDVRTGVEYSEGHIPEAININVMDDSFRTLSDSLLTKDVPVAVYCRSGKRSKAAADILSKKGFKVYELAKGFNSWQKAGKEIVK